MALCTDIGSAAETGIKILATRLCVARKGSMLGTGIVCWGESFVYNFPSHGRLTPSFMQPLEYYIYTFRHLSSYFLVGFWRAEYILITRLGNRRLVVSRFRWGGGMCPFNTSVFPKYFFPPGS